jgi:hypothetical protein
MNLMPALVTVKCCSNAVLDLMPTWTSDDCPLPDLTDHSDSDYESDDDDDTAAGAATTTPDLPAHCEHAPCSPGAQAFDEVPSASVGSSVGSCKVDTKRDSADTPRDCTDGDSSIRHRHMHHLFNPTIQNYVCRCTIKNHRSCTTCET